MRADLVRRIFFILILSGLIWSCKDDDELKPDEPTDPVAVDPDIKINEWILEIMGTYYYWLDNMKTPISVTSDPEDYFESLLFRPTDRFSVIYPDFQELVNSLSGVTLEAGYEFNLFRESSSNENVIAEVTYVKKNSPAATQGIMRGDIIRRINGTQLDVNNYRELLGQTDETHTISYLRYNETLNGYEAKPDMTLTTTQLAENPNFLDTVYTINNQKIGYFVYHFFAPGSGGNNTAYDDEMDAVFAKFKSENINHLILDLRYNTGGYVSSAVNLASLIGPAVDSTKVLSKTKYNSFLMQFSNFNNDVTNFRTKSQNLGASLSGNRVYVLTSSRSASSSELVINGLKPYMDVFIIGDVTSGKNVGSAAIQDEENPENDYGLLPIITQSFNSLDQSDYSNGFEPNIEALEYTERLRPLGDVNELLLRTAIGQITGSGDRLATGRIQKLDRLDLGSTLDRKTRTGRMIESPVAMEKQ